MSKEQTYLFEYDHDGGTYTLDIVATSEAEARAKLQSLRASSPRFLGTLVARLPAWSGMGIVANIIVWFRNFFAPGNK